MKRDNVLVIRLTKGERQRVEALAQVEKLPISTLVRRRLMFECERRGLVPDSGRDPQLH